MKIGRYKIVKSMHQRMWKHSIKRRWLFWWYDVRCDRYGNIDLNLSYDWYDIKYFDTEAEAEEAIQNLIYKKPIFKV